MRVIGGSARGRPLKAKLPSTVRPTTDYAREAIFSMLESRGDSTTSWSPTLLRIGAMGIEAMSRGAAKVYFIDSDPACLAAVKLNLEPLNFDAEASSCARCCRCGPRRTTSTSYSPIALRTARPRERVARRRGRARHCRERSSYGADRSWIVTKTKRYGTTLVTMLEPDEGGV